MEVWWLVVLRHLIGRLFILSSFQRVRIPLQLSESKYLPAYSKNVEKIYPQLV
jgi:hypothetical protein